MSTVRNVLAVAAAALLLMAGAVAGQDEDRDEPKEQPKEAVPGLNHRRPATAEEIARLVKDLGEDRYAVRQKAMKVLEEIGQPAVAALSEAARKGPIETQRRAQQLLDRIEANESLAPTLVKLQLKDVPVPKAVEELNRQSRLKLELVPQQGPARQQLEQRRVNLDLPKAPFWEALEKLCEAGGLTYAPRGNKTFTLQMLEGGTPTRAPTAYSGAFRVRVTGMNYFRNVSLLGGGGNQQAIGVGTNRSEGLTVSFDVLAEPHVKVMGIGGPKLVDVVDEGGESLLSEGAGNSGGVSRASYYPGQPMMQTLTTQASLRPSTKAGATLKTLKGSLSVELLAQRKPMVQIDNILKARGKVYKGEGEMSLMIMQVQDQGGQNGNIRFALSGLEKMTDEMNMLRSGHHDALRPSFELTDADGRPFQLNLSINYYPDPNQGNNVLEGSFYYSPQQDTGPPARFTYYGLKRVRANVPFEFRDVPMP